MNHSRRDGQRLGGTGGKPSDREPFGPFRSQYQVMDLFSPLLLLAGIGLLTVTLVAIARLTADPLVVRSDR